MTRTTFTRSFVATVLLCVVVAVAGEGQVRRFDRFDTDVFFLGDRGSVEETVQELVAEPTKLWRRSDVDLPEFYRQVLRSGSGEGRLGLTRAIFVTIYVYSAVPWDAMDLLPVEASLFETLLPTLRSGAAGSREEVRKIVLETVREMERFVDELPALIEKEFARRRMLARDPGLSEGGRLTLGAARDDEVLRILLRVAEVAQYVGSRGARIAAGTVHRDGGLGFSADQDQARVPVNGRLIPLGLSLERLPEAKHTVVGRELDPRVRTVVEQLLKGGETIYRDTASLLVDARPVSESSAELVYDVHCGSMERDCESYLVRLYAGPDDAALGAIQARVDERIVSLLAESSERRRARCERRAELDVGPTGATAAHSAESPLRRVEREISRATERIAGQLELVERIDRPGEPVLDAVLAYWTKERDPRARALLARHGLLTAGPLGRGGQVPALGNCLALGR